MGSSTNKPQLDQAPTQGQEGQEIHHFSVPVSETLPIAQEPAEDPNQPSEPTQPTNEDPSQTPPSEEAAESNS